HSLWRSLPHASSAVPNIFKEPLVIRVEGRDETDGFVWQGMPVLRDAKGLFALRFTRDSDLVERFFEPAATASKKLEVMGWTPPETVSTKPDGVCGFPSAAGPCLVARRCNNLYWRGAMSHRPTRNPQGLQQAARKQASKTDEMTPLGLATKLTSPRSRG